jgi:hypothetical protein
MADRLDYYFRQRVSEAELDLAFELLEKADRNLAADIGVFGVISGAEPTPHSPIADLTIDLTAPARAYDRLGQRIFFGTGQRVDCSVDDSGIPTEITVAGRERWLGVFLRFDRLLSDPRTDGNSQQVYFRRDETFDLVVRQGPEAAVGTAPKVPLQEDELLICDVLRRHGQTQIIGGDLDTSRRQAFIFATGDAVQIGSGLWTALAPAVETVQAALDSADALLAGHFAGASNKHSAAHINSTAHGFVAATNVQAALDEIVDDLASAAAGTPGASRVGADAVAGTPNALPAGNVDGQLSQLLAWLNAHVGAVTGAHNASAIVAAAHAYISGVNVQSQLQEIVTDLAATTAGAAGASRVGVADAGDNLTATDVEAALAELADALEGDHFRGNESNAGQHRAIRQPNLGGTKALLWDSLGNGGTGTHLRVYADADSVWLTLNASWNGSAWARDNTGFYSGGFRFSRLEFEIFHDLSFTATFTTWSRTWRLPISSTTNSAFELTGTVQEIGRLGMEWSNSDTATRTIAGGGSVTFRNRFPATPSSITFSVLNANSGFSGSPSSYFADRDGFGFYSYQTIAALGTAWWFGTYTAVA